MASENKHAESDSESSTNIPLPQCVVYPSRTPQHTATVFFLHGLGDSARNIGPLLEDLTQHPALTHVKFILPTAPMMPITGMRGRVIPSWFDCCSFNHLSRKEDEAGLYKAAKWIQDLTTKEELEHNIPSNRVIIGGISQGGATATLAALTSEKPLAGLFSISSYVPLRKKITEIATEFAKTMPIFWGHGTEDRQVDFKIWKGLAKVLAGQLGIPFIDSEQSVWVSERVSRENETAGLLFYTYEDLGHWFNEQELQDVAKWISILIPEQA
ncbi:hypothetical protein M413DRAFT_251578 [Hebeloma cylindrosporum]|uniref:Acyl-protein thioesterase 1 n=1 Tax=Hebeloma cylindrosporum TaxID=76867 RepID=A0A0C3C0Q0_HEBCY|nr:hypothetical protein M413DRAFT_251578 [Hebeloma cylindrosporum h7]